MLNNFQVQAWSKISVDVLYYYCIISPPNLSIVTLLFLAAGRGTFKQSTQLWQLHLHIYNLTNLLIYSTYCTVYDDSSEY